ncbi:replication initiation factor domain-containing protein [Oscillibacter sp.]|uniref:replication initiation factor domain-containing protein n=1 Tax=Oscillibacter sp. TaxID=1945593 RepID=UPI002D7E5B73|nr:replication initiation factor domain-containing protein [Oscillibacter sp.]
MKCQVSIDWLTFSVKKDDPGEVIKDYLGLDPVLFQDTGYSLLGYNKVLRFSDICVCYDPRQNDFFKNMGVCVSMSGNGCRAFETMSKLGKDKPGEESVAFLALFQLLTADESANISRLDIACDDREGYLDMEQIIKKTRALEINSRLRWKDIHESINGESKAGSTVYIGAPSSDFRIRIYDKALEQGVDGHWIRVELVMRKENANAFVEEMTQSENVGKLAAQVMNDKFAFIERDDSNITRCTVCGWWQTFVDEIEEVHLVARCVVQHSVERISNWVEAQVGPSLAILVQTMGPRHIVEIAMDSLKRLTDKQEFLISDYNSFRTAAAL